MSTPEPAPADAAPETASTGAERAVPSPADVAAAKRRAMHVLALGSLGVFVVFLDTTIVNVAFETISRSFDTTTGHLAWVLNAYSLVFAAMLIPAGRLADRYGRKRIFLIGLAGFAGMSALCGAAPDAGVLIAARALQGVFAALVVPTSLALILPEFPASRRHVAVGTWGAMGAAAATLGPTLGALLTEYASWRWIFLVNVPICALMIVFGLRLLRESRDPHAAGVPDPIGVLFVAAIPALLSFAIIEGPSWGWSDPRVVIGFVLTALLLPAFVWRSSAAAQPVMDLALFKVRQFRLTNAATLLFATAFYGMLLSNIIFLQTEWHYSVLRAALATTPGPLLVTAVARSASKLAGNIGHRPVLMAGAASWAAGAATFALTVGGSPHWFAHWLPASLLIGLGIGLTLPVQSGAAVESLSPSRYAIGSAVNSSFRQLGAVLGISVFVAVLGAPDGVRRAGRLPPRLVGIRSSRPGRRRRPVPSTAAPWRPGSGRLSSLGPVAKVPPGLRCLARTLAALSASPEYVQYTGEPPPCDRTHQTPQSPPSGRTALLSQHALVPLPATCAPSRLPAPTPAVLAKGPSSCATRDFSRLAIARTARHQPLRGGRSLTGKRCRSRHQRPGLTSVSTPLPAAAVVRRAVLRHLVERASRTRGTSTARVRRALT
jgi:EmrB/QacA subfamily drug resistance transporter